MNWIRRHPRLCLFAVVVLGIAVFGVARKIQGPAVEVARAVVGPIQHAIVVSGRVEALHRVEIGSVITGRAEQVLVAEGAVVKAGQPLIVLETRELEASLAQARAQEASARARLATVRELNLPQSSDAVVQAEAQFQWAEKEYAPQPRTARQGLHQPRHGCRTWNGNSPWRKASSTPRARQAKAQDASRRADPRGRGAIAGGRRGARTGRFEARADDHARFGAGHGAGARGRAGRHREPGQTAAGAQFRGSETRLDRADRREKSSLISRSGSRHSSRATPFLTGTSRPCSITSARAWT